MIVDKNDIPLIQRYCEKMSSRSDDPILYTIERNTFLNTVKPFDASDYLQGRLLSLLSNLIRPSLIIEIGTFTAYATVCLAEGLASEGRLITIEEKKELRSLIQGHIDLCTQSNQIEVKFGKALEILHTIDVRIDLVFIDAAKKEYKEYYNLLIDKVRPGGLIIADNVLWKGEVVHSNKTNMAESLDQFNQMIAQDERVEAFILPYRDGLLMIQKK